MIGATLFSGIGAPECAMPEWHWPWCAEIEKFPSAVLAARHPQSVNLGDVGADDFAERALAIAGPDVVVFGSPCQSFSVAGKRLGMDDPRGNLALIALGILDRIRPAWFVFENVPGLLSLDNGDAFRQFLQRVDELRYSLAWASLDAQWRGVAQRRERVFAVGYLGDWRCPAAVLFEPESLCGDSPPRRKAGQGIAPTIAARTKGGGGLGTDFDCDGGLVASHDIALIAHSLRADGFDASEDGTGRGTPLIPILEVGKGSSSRGAGPNGSGIGSPGDPMFTLQSGAQHAVAGAISVCLGSDPIFAEELAQPMTLRAGDPGVVAFSCKDHGADANELAPTLRAMGHNESRANAGGQVAVAFQESQTGTREYDTAGTLRSDGPGHDPVGTRVREGWAVRRLTPRECERLQGFPDDYTAVAYRGKPACDGPRYKALGNSMAVPIMRMILERLQFVDELQQRAAA